MLNIYDNYLNLTKRYRDPLLLYIQYMGTMLI
jgi:hypothetical protein